MFDFFSRGKIMKNKMMKGLCLALLTVSQVAIADMNDIKLGVPGYGGNGCPANSASVTLSEDAKSLSIIFCFSSTHLSNYHDVTEKYNFNVKSFRIFFDSFNSQDG